MAAATGEVLVYESTQSSIESVETLSQDGVEKIDGPTQEVERRTRGNKRRRRNYDVVGGLGHLLRK